MSHDTPPPAAPADQAPAATTTLAERIRLLRGSTPDDIAAGLLAHHYSISAQTFSDWESGRQQPDVTGLEVLSKAFRCDMSWLLFGCGRGPQHSPEELELLFLVRHLDRQMFVGVKGMLKASKASASGDAMKASVASRKARHAK